MRNVWLEAMAAALLLLAPATGRGANGAFAYQGLLLNEKGQVLSARNHTIVFRIYDQPSGGDPLWTCTRKVFLNEKGLFSVELSGNAVSGQSLDALLLAKASKTLYIGLTVDNDTDEIAPRQKLLSVPKAVSAATCLAAKNGLTVSNTCYATSAKISGTVKVNSLTVNGGLSCKSLYASSITNNKVFVSAPGTVSGHGTIPVGGIVIWSGVVNRIPDGWTLCDGVNAPDLRDRFIVGVGPTISNGRVNQEGGEASHVLTLEEMPPHRHDYVFGGADIDLEWHEKDLFFCQHNQYPNFKHRGTTFAVGGGEAHENRPPYYALCYIMRIR